MPSTKIQSRSFDPYDPPSVVAAFPSLFLARSEAATTIYPYYPLWFIPNWTNRFALYEKAAAYAREYIGELKKGFVLKK